MTWTWSIPATDWGAKGDFKIRARVNTFPSSLHFCSRCLLTDTAQLRGRKMCFRDGMQTAIKALNPSNERIELNWSCAACLWCLPVVCCDAVCWIGAAAVCLGLLLLTLILVAHSEWKSTSTGWVQHSTRAHKSTKAKSLFWIVADTSSVNQWDAKYTSLIFEITKGRDELKDERDELQTRVSNLTQEMVMLQNRYQTAAASRDKLQEEINKLSFNRTGKHFNCRHFSFTGCKIFFFPPCAQQLHDQVWWLPPGGSDYLRRIIYDICCLLIYTI